MITMEIPTFRRGKKLLTEIHVLGNGFDYDLYDCIIDSGADSFHIHTSWKWLNRMNFVPLAELREQSGVKVNKKADKFVSSTIGTAGGIVPAFEGVLRIVTIGNLVMIQPKCTITITDKNDIPVFLFPLLHIFEDKITIDQRKNKIECDIMENGLIFIYCYNGLMRKAVHIKEIDKINYKDLIKQEYPFSLRKDNFTSLLYHENRESNLEY